jgi:hypothetical protein
MTIAVGAGSIRAGLTNSRGAQSCISELFLRCPASFRRIDYCFALVALISMVWAVMTLASCIVNPQVASATHAMTAFNHFVISGVLLWNGGFSIPELVGLGKQSATRNSRPRQSIGGRR